jgi:hypothetical protein
MLEENADVVGVRVLKTSEHGDVQSGKLVAEAGRAL